MTSDGSRRFPPTRARTRALRLRLLPGCYPTPGRGARRRRDAEPLERIHADLTRSGARGFEPPTFCSQIYEGGVPGSVNPSQPAEMITESDPPSVQPSQGFAGQTKDFVTRLLPNSGGRQPGVRPHDADPGWDTPGTGRPCATTPTLGDLAGLYGGRTRLLSVADVADQVGVCGATVYRLCESGELPHVRIVNSIRIRPADLAAFLASGSQPDASGKCSR
jgi:excisionase family DNA binding protein